MSKRLYATRAEKQADYRRRQFDKDNDLKRIREAAIRLLKARGEYDPNAGTQGIVSALDHV